jgi:hypothetical protein
MKRLVATEIKAIANISLGVVKIDCRQNFFWVLDANKKIRLGRIWRGIRCGDLLKVIDSAKTYGDLL